MSTRSRSTAPAVVMERIVAEQGCYRGNACTDAQLSWHIRPSSERFCNGRSFAPGVLREADLKPFGPYIDGTSLASRVTARPTVLYVWRHMRAGAAPMVYGATLTDRDGVILGRQTRRRSRSGSATVRFLERAAGLKEAA